MEESKRIERSIITTYRKTIWNRFIEGVKNYRMVNEGDRIAVCLSGGKDSALLVKCMQQLQRYGDCRFSLKVIVMDPGYSEENRKKIEENCARMALSLIFLKPMCLLRWIRCRKTPAICVPVCGEGISTPAPSRWAATRLRWGIILTT